MRHLVDVARRLLETRKTVKALEALGSGAGELTTLDASRLLVFRGALHALAWALEIDLGQMDPPPLTNLPEQPERVTLHRVELEDATGAGGRCLWLTEIPAHTDPVDPGFSTEYWSCFLSDETARDLYRALGETLALASGSSAETVCTLPRLHPARPAASSTPATPSTAAPELLAGRSPRTLTPRRPLLTHPLDEADVAGSALTSFASPRPPLRGA